MKLGLQVAVVALLLAGCCSTSKLAHDPRAAMVGPDYLDYIEQHPRDYDTQYYYPGFTIADLKDWKDPMADLVKPALPNLQALLTTRPPMAPSVQQIEGKGWPDLEGKPAPLLTRCFSMCIEGKRWQDLQGKGISVFTSEQK